MVTRRKCLICNRTDKSDSTISFHILPKEKDLRKAWVIACNLDESYINKQNSNYRICSKHFMESDFRITRIGGPRILKAQVVPSVFILEGSIAISNLQSWEHYSKKTYSSPTENLDKIPQNITNVDRLEITSVKNETTNLTDAEEFLMDYLPEKIEKQIILEPSSEMNMRLATDVQNTPQKPEIYILRPCRISDCTKDRLNTLRNAKRNSDLAKLEANNKQRKIKMLLQKNSRLLDKVKSYSTSKIRKSSS